MSGDETRRGLGRVENEHHRLDILAAIELLGVAHSCSGNIEQRLIRLAVLVLLCAICVTDLCNCRLAADDGDLGNELLPTSCHSVRSPLARERERARPKAIAQHLFSGIRLPEASSHAEAANGIVDGRWLDVVVG